MILMTKDSLFDVVKDEIQPEDDKLFWIKHLPLIIGIMLESLSDGYDSTISALKVQAESELTIK